MRIAIATALLLAAACKPAEKPAPPIGDPARGKAAIDRYGCTGCHVVPGVEGHGAIGPSLDHVATRPVIAGKVSNTPQNLVAYLQDPQASDPANQMPKLGVTNDDAKDIAAYLGTLR